MLEKKNQQSQTKKQTRKPLQVSRAAHVSLLVTQEAHVQVIQPSDFPDWKTGIQIPSLTFVLISLKLTLGIAHIPPPPFFFKELLVLCRAHALHHA